MTEHAPVDTPLAEVSTEDAAAAVADLAALIEHHRDLHRQSDVKAGQSLTVVGLVSAAATAVLPRLDGPALALAVAAVVAVVLAGALFGFVLTPRVPRPHPNTTSAVVQAALERVRDPRATLDRIAAEVVNLEAITDAKHTLIRGGMMLLGMAFVFATLTALTAAVTAIVSS
jgi:hypothetical protein